MLEYLEDIIGTAKYVPQIEAKEVEVDKLNDSRGEVLNRVKVGLEREKSMVDRGERARDAGDREERSGLVPAEGARAGSRAVASVPVLLLREREGRARSSP